MQNKVTFEKLPYEAAEVEIITLASTDVLSDSGDPDELPWI